MLVVAAVVGCSVTDKTRVIGEIGKLLGAKWKELDDDEKKVCMLYLVDICGLTALLQPYLDQAQADKARAEEEKNAYDVRTRFPCGLTPVAYLFFRRARRPTAVAETGMTMTSEQYPALRPCICAPFCPSVSVLLSCVYGC